MSELTKRGLKMLPDGEYSEGKRFKSIKKNALDGSIDRILEIESLIRVQIPVNIDDNDTEYLARGGFIYEPFFNICYFGGLRLISDLIARTRPSQIPEIIRQPRPHYSGEHLSELVIQEMTENIEPVGPKNNGEFKLFLKSRSTLISCPHKFLCFVRKVLELYNIDVLTADESPITPYDIFQRTHDVILICDETFSNMLRRNHFITKIDTQNVGDVSYNTKRDFITCVAVSEYFLAYVMFDRIVTYHSFKDSMPDEYPELSGLSEIPIPKWHISKHIGHGIGHFGHHFLSNLETNDVSGGLVKFPSAPKTNNAFKKLTKFLSVPAGMPVLDYHISHDIVITYHPYHAHHDTHHILLPDLFYSEKSSRTRKLLSEIPPITVTVHQMRTDDHGKTLNDINELLSLKRINITCEELCEKLKDEFIDLCESVLKEEEIEILEKYWDSGVEDSTVFFDCVCEKPKVMISDTDTEIFNDDPSFHCWYNSTSVVYQLLYSVIYKRFNSDPKLIEKIHDVMKSEYGLRLKLFNLETSLVKHYQNTKFPHDLDQLSIISFGIFDISFEQLIVTVSETLSSKRFLPINRLSGASPMDYDKFLDLLECSPNYKLLCCRCQTHIDFVGSILCCGHMFCVRHCGIVLEHREEEEEEELLTQCPICWYPSKSYLFSVRHDLAPIKKCDQTLEIQANISGWPSLWPHPPVSNDKIVVPVSDFNDYGAEISILRQMIPTFVGKNVVVMSHYHVVSPSKNYHLEKSLDIPPYTDVVWGTQIPYHDRIRCFANTKNSENLVNLLVASPTETHPSHIIRDVDILIVYIPVSEQIYQGFLAVLRPRYCSDLIVIRIECFEYFNHFPNDEIEVEIVECSKFCSSDVFKEGPLKNYHEEFVGNLYDTIIGSSDCECHYSEAFAEIFE